MRVENLNVAKFATYMVLAVGLSASALASCGAIRLDAKMEKKLCRTRLRRLPQA